MRAGVEPMTRFRLLVRMLYHLATGDSWEFRPLNESGSLSSTSSKFQNVLVLFINITYFLDLSMLVKKKLVWIDTKSTATTPHVHH